MISVCIPTHNGGKYIRTQIDSILCQLGENDEVIVSDDSSIDDTVVILESYKDDRMKIIKNQTFYNPIFNIENALKRAKGDYIFLADQDDIWKKDKVQTMLVYLKKYDLVIGDCEIINENNIIVYNSFFKQFNKGKGLVKNFIYDSYLGCNMAFNRKFLAIVLPFPANIPMHDIWIGTIGELLFKVYFCPEILMQYRRHPETYTNTCTTSKNSIGKKILFRLQLLKSIVIRMYVFLLAKNFSSSN